MTLENLIVGLTFAIVGAVTVLYLADMVRSGWTKGGFE